MSYIIIKTVYGMKYYLSFDVLGLEYWRGVLGKEIVLLGSPFDAMKHVNRYLETSYIKMGETITICEFNGSNIGKVISEFTPKNSSRGAYKLNA